MCMLTNLSVPPKADEGVGKDAAVSAAVAIVVRHPFPRHNTGEALWLAGCNSPLTSGVITHAEQTNFAG